MPCVFFQCAATIVILCIGETHNLINYVSFINYLSYGVTIAGLLYHRWKKPNLYRPIKVPALLTLAHRERFTSYTAAGHRGRRGNSHVYDVDDWINMILLIIILNDHISRRVPKMNYGIKNWFVEIVKLYSSLT